MLSVTVCAISNVLKPSKRLNAGAAKVAVRILCWVRDRRKCRQTTQERRGRFSAACLADRSDNLSVRHRLRQWGMDRGKASRMNR
jgi:hypothetical protein